MSQLGSSTVRKSDHEERPCLKCRHCPRCDQIKKQEGRCTEDQPTENEQLVLAADSDSGQGSISPKHELAAASYEETKLVEAEKAALADAPSLEIDSISLNATSGPVTKIKASQNQRAMQEEHSGFDSLKPQTEALQESSSTRDDKVDSTSDEIQPTRCTSTTRRW